MAAEGAVLEDMMAEARRSGTLGDLPLTVVTATGPEWWPGMPENIDRAQFQRTWLQLQQDLTRLSTNSTQVFADRSGHFIQFDQPDVLVQAIRRVVDIVRQSV